MKRRLLIILLCVFAFACLFATSVFATVNYNETATLADGTVLPIYDEDNNPLIWYVSGTDENGNNVYSSVPNNRNEANENNDCRYNQSAFLRFITTHRFLLAVFLKFFADYLLITMPLTEIVTSAAAVPGSHSTMPRYIARAAAINSASVA